LRRICTDSAPSIFVQAVAMPEITKNVKFENVAREWRFKWSADSDKESLTSAQAKLEDVLAELSSVEGVASIQRVVCGGCLDFKVVTKLPAAAFGEWEKSGFAPEAEFVKAVTAIPGVTSVETQTYTLEEIKMSKKAIKSAEDRKKQKEEAAAPKEAEPVDPVKKLKKVIKEGGKRGVEIEGAADMGGLQFFCTSVDEPDGDIEMALECVKAMNAEPEPDAEERKGCSKHVGKMVFSAGVDQLACVAYVPEAKQGELSGKEWLQAVVSIHPGGKVLTDAKDFCTGCIPANADKGIFPLKIKESLILESNNFLRNKGLFPEDKGDDSDEMVFGDDDFPS